MEKGITKSGALLVLACIYCSFTCIMNLFEMKTIGTEEFAFGGGGIFVSWAVFMIMDITTELFGEKQSIKIYTLAGIINLVLVIFAQIIIAMPGVYEEQNVAFAQIFSNGIRSALASFIAFWVGNFVNVHIMVKMKNMDVKGSKLLLFVRAVVSTIFGQFVDNMLFATLAFAPIGLSLFEMEWRDILTSALFGTGMETLVESCFVPFITIPVITMLNKKFKEEV